MMKKVFCVIISVLMVFSCCLFCVSCDNNETNQENNINKESEKEGSTESGSGSEGGTESGGEGGEEGSKEAETTYTITFDSDGGTEIESINVKYDEEITLPTPEKDDYTFIKWIIKGTNIIVSNGAWKYKQNIELKAIWEADFTKFY